MPTVLWAIIILILVIAVRIILQRAKLCDHHNSEYDSQRHHDFKHHPQHCGHLFGLFLAKFLHA
ncbi:hypothetical protein [Methylomicrobium lacus]|uniref:hypothetical protein n=1 Tax=Methylomicrobium lacus TaxID=136992 RepID=UPI0012693B4E|nr:hypothetical protein [Methylomicrobium lacus]